MQILLSESTEHESLSRIDTNSRVEASPNGEEYYLRTNSAVYYICRAWQKGNILQVHYHKSDNRGRSVQKTEKVHINQVRQLIKIS